MSLEVMVFVGCLLAMLIAAAAWTIKLAYKMPAMQDMIPMMANEQYFIVFAKQRGSSKQS